MSDTHTHYMKLAIDTMFQTGIVKKTGGPFGAVIVKDGKILANCGNTVVRDNDPTAHAEINAIRQACKSIGSFNLEGAILYTSCQCCPMCYAAAYWARISKIYFASRWEDCADIFDDSKIGKEFLKPDEEKLLHPECLLREEALVVWDSFKKMIDGARY